MRTLGVLLQKPNLDSRILAGASVRLDLSLLGQSLTSHPRKQQKSLLSVSGVWTMR
jgi:hypothetical protein